MKLLLDTHTFIDMQKQTNGLEILTIKYSHVIAIKDLALYHKDPFDRMLITQSRVEDLILVSKDAIFNQYEVNLVW